MYFDRIRKESFGIRASVGRVRLFILSNAVSGSREENPSLWIPVVFTCSYSRSDFGDIFCIDYWISALAIEIKTSPAELFFNKSCIMKRYFKLDNKSPV